MTSSSLTDLHDDILIFTLSWIEPSDLLSVRKTCKRLYSLTHTRIVWTNACIRYILAQGYPFPNVPLDSLSIANLERLTRHAYQLGQKWRSKSLRPRSILFNDSVSGANISDVLFLPGHDDKWLITASKSVWSVLTLWDISSLGSGRQPQTCKWSPKGGIFKKFCLNSDPTSTATLAIALLHEAKEMLYILSVITEGETVSFNIVTSFPTNFVPVSLQGDIVGLSDERSQISIWNWRDNKHATLSCQDDEGTPFQHNVCSQIIFSRSTNSIIAVRDVSISLFPFPELKAKDESPVTYAPIAQYHFGWIDGVTATPVQPIFNGTTRNGESPQSISLLLRRKNNDPWHSAAHSIEHHVLLPNPSYDPETPIHPLTPSSIQESTTQTGRKPSSNLPYLFPPVPRSKIPNLRGSLGRLLHRSNMILGKSGTAVWINPQDLSVGGLYFSDDESPLQIVPYIERSDQRLVAAVFHGPLSPDGVGAGNGAPDGNTDIDISTIYVNDSNNWTALDYDEITGRIAIGSASGDLLVFVL
ncbi:hypothetical protein F5887DRAFT_48807 [Amanita rubescens]|nr:hypothetical protein F5887DRAFT_48807 [Amanita rubescens]